ncbi:two-component sensor histidine kinase [Streptomyces sulfonofaciens]|uniref:Sensor-like histidine kinase SenX3 n=1 Tax=Streptomyces sulfonofaciens TaxID=68272 RepID=A0A919L1D8_9ACTN|nr:HAMP domain-containing sensor histidine kinase [Streptomyces sulfonofaciens]GHH81280.1 two-component sensor histidine kinase [Streptomyces sulfonofaciens]
MTRARGAPAGPHVPDGGQTRMLARARRAITAWVTAVAAVLLLVVGGVIYAVTTRGQSSDISRDLRYAARYADVSAPPACVWLVVTHGAATYRSPGTPAGFPVRAAVRQVRAGRGDVSRDVTVGGAHYRVLTTHRGRDVVQAVRDLRYARQERHHLLMAVAAAEAAGLAGAALLGTLLARRATAPLGEALSRQRRFVADASHELRTPLTRLHTRAQLLVRLAGTLALPEPVAADLRQLVATSRQLGDVIDDLLLSARLPHAPVLTVAVDLAALAEEICREEQVRAGLDALTLTARAEGGPHLVAGVPSALRRAVSALVDNAIGHTPPGGRVTLTVGAHGDGSVVLTVRDTGGGFEPHRAEHLFERFAHGHTGRGRRFGIGLALVREVVHGHGGSVHAEGEPGSGARFTVRLPALAPADRPQRPRTRPCRAALARRPAAKERAPKPTAR